MIKNLWGKLAYYWFVLMLIIIGFFSGNLNVNAAVANYSSTTSQIDVINSSVRPLTSQWGTLINPGGSYSVPTNGIYYTREFAFRIYGGTNTYSSSNNYTATFTFKINCYSDDPNCYKDFVKRLKDQYYVIRISANVNSEHNSNTSADNIKSFSYQLVETPTKNEYRLTVNFVPTKNVKFVIVYFYNKQGKNLELTNDSWSEDRLLIQRKFLKISSYEYKALSYSYQEGTNGAITEQTGVIIQQTNIINDSITDDDIDAPDDMINEFEDLLPQNGIITQLITLPIMLYTRVLNSINGTCSAFNLGTLYGHQLTLPCIDISTYLGSSVWNTIDLIISGTFVLIIAKKMIKAFENFTSMKEGDVINND